MSRRSWVSLPLDFRHPSGTPMEYVPKKRDPWKFSAKPKPPRPSKHNIPIEKDPWDTSEKDAS